MARPRGGQPDYVIGRDNRQIKGLSYSQWDEKYYATHSRPRKWFGRDFNTALIAFRAWESQQSGETVTVTLRETPVERLDWTPPERAFVNAAHCDRGQEVSHLAERRIADKATYWAGVLENILLDPAEAAQFMGLPADWLRSVKPPALPSLTLSQVWALFLQRRKQKLLTAQTVSDNKRYWSNFADDLGVRTVVEITPEIIQDYERWLHDEKEENGLSAA